MRKQTKIAAITSAAALLAIGASMTAFANTWVGSGYDWTYVDSNGQAIEEEGWHRGRSDWSSENAQATYFSDENGKMVFNDIVEYGDSLYYVDDSGRRVVNTWVPWDLDEEYEMPDGEIASSVYLFFDAKGKAVQATADEFVVKEEIKDTNRTDKGYFIFNEDGYMMLGKVETGDGIYYATQKDDAAFIELDGAVFADTYVTGEALNGWAKMDVEFLLGEEAADNDDYETKEWFYFEKGKLYQPGGDGGTKAIGGVTYVFDGNGVLGLWNGTTSASNSNTDPEVKSTYKVYVDSNNSTTSGNKWEDVGNYNWRYIINARDFDTKALIAKGIIFNYNYKDSMDQKIDVKTGTLTKFENNGEGYSRMIKVNGKVYMIGPDGLMKTGVQEVTPAMLATWGKDAIWNGGKYEFIWNNTFKYYVPDELADIAWSAWRDFVSGRSLENYNTYYFRFDDSKDLDGDRGEQVTGKYTYTDSSENEVTRIFTSDGIVKNGYALYGEYLYKDGELVVAEDGAAYYPVRIGWSGEEGCSLRKYSIKGSTVEKIKKVWVDVKDDNGEVVKDEHGETLQKRVEVSGEELIPTPDKDADPVTYYVIVDKNGKVKKSASTSKGLVIDDLTYDVKNYIATVRDTEE